MKRLILAIVLATAIATTANAKSDVLKSIRPLQTMVTVEFFGTEVEMRRNICTTWATTYHGERVWATAAHCAAGRTDKPTWIDGKPASFVTMVFSENGVTDVAVYRGGPSGVQPFVLAQVVNVADGVWSAGYPGGSDTLLYTRGYVSAKSDDEGMAVYGIPVAGGDSGSPIVDEKSGLVVGIVTQTMCNPRYSTWCPIMRGTTLENLRRALDVN